MIDISHVSKWFGDTCVLHDISFTVKKGEICGFVGENGAGKSTTMRILATLLTEYTGTVKIHGLDVMKSIPAVRRMIGFMPDQYGLYDDLKVGEYLEFFALSYGMKHSTKKISDVLTDVQLLDKIDTPIKGLSRGMTQRICLAKALIHNPDVLILDEPASGLDPKLRVLLRNILVALKEKGKTILVSSHILSELGDYCDSVVFISQGKISKQVDLHAKRVAPPIKISTTDNAMARTLLATHPAIEEISLITKGLLLHGKALSSDDILQFCLSKGLHITFFDTSQDLEDMYLEIVKN